MARVSFKPKRVSSIDATSEVATVANGEVFVDSSTGMYYYKNTSGAIKQGFQEEVLAALTTDPRIHVDFVNSESVPSFLQFARGSDAYFVDKTGYLAKAQPGAPRIQYSPVTGACRGLFMENSATNLFISTQDFRSNANGNVASMWGNTNITVANSTVIAPDNVSTCQLLTTIEDGACLSGVTKGTISTGSRVAISVYAKMKTSRYLRFELGGVVNCWFDLRDGVAGAHSAGNSNVTFNSKFIEKMRDGWYRCSLVVIANNVPQLQVNMFTAETENSASLANGDVYLWGAQAEIGYSASSYIPSTTALVAREHDYCYTRDGFLLQSGVNSTGTIVVEMDSRPSGTIQTIVSLEDSYQSRLQLRRVSQTSNNTVGDLTAMAYFYGASNLNISRSGAFNGYDEIHRIAFAYTRNNCGVTMNGTSIGGDSVVDIPALLSRLNIGCSEIGGTGVLDGHIRSVAIYNAHADQTTRAALTI